ncbi:MAG: chlorite dismutase family protein [Actinomycetota bacterium]|nr:chlorite dismutase family protein [Actinomycetota bacterium]MDP8954851.1 chlorite dismutase family protein [Actinomycetota bacterium]
MPELQQTVVPGEGLAVLHLFCRLSPGADRQGVTVAVKQAEGGEHQVVPFAVLGHKADVGFMAIGPDLWQLRRLQRDLQGAGLEIAGSYVSLTEVSEYAQGVPERAKRERLYPTLPPAGMPALCFYPMSKRRNVGQNWYTLPYEERLELMYDHGKSGRAFAGRVVQLVTGSTGLDDFEWAVTLFGVGPDDLKECVHTMRFDAGSAHYADFGPFITGLVAPLDEVLDHVGLT